MGFKKSSFNFIHKKTCVRWGKLGTNSGTRNLLLNSPIKLKIVILQNKIYDLFKFICRKCECVFFSLIKYLLRAFNPASCGMVGYKPTMSIMTKIALLVIEPKSHVFFYKVFNVRPPHLH